jgi:hypothetical protein
MTPRKWASRDGIFINRCRTRRANDVRAYRSHAAFNPHMSQDVDKRRRDAELDRAIEKYLRACMAAGLTKDEALERLYELTKETAVGHQRSQFKIVSRE